MGEQRVERGVRMGDVIEFTLRGERITAEAMLVTDDDVVLLDLFDGDRPAWATARAPRRRRRVRTGRLIRRSVPIRSSA